MKTFYLPLVLFPIFFAPVLYGQTPINPLLHNGLAIALPDSGTYALDARWLVLHPDTCANYAYSADPADRTRLLNCDELGTNPMNIWTTHAGALRPTLTGTHVQAQDNTGVCDNPGGPARPVIICRNGLATTLGPDGTIELLARQWDAGSAAANNDPGMRLSFSNDPADTTRTFDCLEVGSSFFEIWATASSGAQNVCYVYALVQDNLGACSGSIVPPGLPFPLLLNGLAVTFDYGGTALLRAADLDAGSRTDNPACLPLQFSFSPDFNDTTTVFDCNMLSTNVVEIWVTDACNQQTSVHTYLLVTNDLVLPCNEPVPAPPNDDRVNAQPLDPAQGCPIYFSNRGATVETNEPEPATGICIDPNVWCDPQGAEHTVWFRFEAPASGSAVLSTSGMNTQLAVWEILNSNLIMVAADDDLPGDPHGAAGLLLTCLEPGKTYWVQVDGFEGAVGQFSLSVSDPGLVCFIAGQISQPLSCGTNPVQPVHSSGTGAWQFLLDAAGDPVAAINDLGQTLGEVSLDFMIHGGPIRTDAAGTPYLDRNWTISVENQPQGPVLVKLLFSAEEIQSLMAAPGGPATPFDLNATKVAGNACGDYPGGGIFLYGLGGYLANPQGALAMHFQVEAFSSFYLHASQVLTGTAEPSLRPLTIAPNPSGRTIRLDGLPGSPDEFLVEVSDLSGNTVLRTRLVGSQPTLELPDLAAGFYTLRVRHGHQTWAGKWVVGQDR